LTVVSWVYSCLYSKNIQCAGAKGDDSLGVVW
jgi:hypothetical protein